MGTLTTVAATVTARQEIKKSRFIGFAGAVADEAQAKQFIAAHSDRAANHNCWAWRIGQLYRFGDDGEPSGTAGRPILQAIDGQSFDRVAVVVTRWFGGVLLGSGGLIRAYGGTASMCLREAERKPLVDTVPAVVVCTFGDLSLVQARLEARADVQVHPPAFNETGAEIPISIPKAGGEDMARMIADLTSGRAEVRFEA